MQIKSQQRAETPTITQGALDEVASKLDAEKSERKQAVEALSKAKQELDDSQKALEKLKSSYDDVVHSLDEMRGELLNTRASRDATEHEKNHLADQLEELHAANLKLQDRVSDLLKQLQDIQAQSSATSQLEVQLKAAETANEALTTELASNKADAAQKQAEFVDIKSCDFFCLMLLQSCRIDDRQHKLDQLQIKIDHMASEHQTEVVHSQTVCFLTSNVDDSARFAGHKSAACQRAGRVAGGGH